ncbi:TPA: bacteriocin immunity protein [Photobacterium damselae]
MFKTNGTSHLLMHFHEIIEHPLSASLIVAPAVEFEDNSPNKILGKIKKRPVSIFNQ